MPAKSDNQATAARIALNAKRNGTINKLPKDSPSHKMATSMSEEELEKFTHVKKEVTNWGKKSLTEVFAEEMLGLDGPGEEIASDKSSNEMVGDISDIDNATRIDSNDAEWSNKVHGRKAFSGSPTALNTFGGRVAEQLEFDREDFGSDQAHDFSDNEVDVDEHSGDAADAMAEMEAQKNDQIINGMVSHLMFHHNKYGTPISQWDPEDLVMDNEYEYDISTENPEDLELAKEAMKIAAQNVGEELPSADEPSMDVATTEESPVVKFPGVETEDEGVSESVESNSTMLNESVSVERWKQLANLK